MESFSLCLLCLALSVLPVLCFSFAARKRSPSQSRPPPGPKPLPLVGNLFELGFKPHQSLARLAKTYGPVMALRLGRVDTLVVSSPEAAREVLQKNDAAFSYRAVADAVKVLGHHENSMVCLPPTQQWRSLRRFCNAHLFSPQRLDAHESLRREKIQEMVRYIAGCSSSEGRPSAAVDVGRVVFTTTLNLISRTLFSTDMADLRSSSSSQEFKDLVEGVVVQVGRPNISDFYPALAMLDLQSVRRRSEELFKKVYAILDEQIDQRLSDMDKQSSDLDFLDAILRFQVQEDGSKFDQESVKPLLTVFKDSTQITLSLFEIIRFKLFSFDQDLFLAGSDSSSSTVTWAMAELVRNPQLMEKARKEIAGEIGLAAEIKESDISRLPYLQAVIKETLRLHPSAPLLIPREVEATIDLLGYTIRKGTRVLVNAWAIGRDGNVWRDPEKFRPERFMEEAEEAVVDYRGRDFALIPFGAGRRICPGLPLAHRVVHLMLASLLQRFQWKLPEGMEAEDVDMSERFGLTMSMASPLKLVADPVSSCS